MSLIEKFSVGIVILCIVLAAAGFFGWCLNIYKLVHLDFKAPYKAEIIRTAGLFPIVGAITGYIDIQD